MTDHRTPEDLAQRSQLSRRGLLGMVAAGAAAVGTGVTLPTTAYAAPSQGTSADLAGRAATKDYWDDVRKLFTLDKKSTFMNVGTVGSPPMEVLDVYDEQNREVAKFAISAYSSFDDVREHAAQDFGCDMDEIALSHNTSDGMAKVVAGLNLGATDEIITTTHEHPGGLGPMGIARDRHGVTITELPVPVGDDQEAEDYVELSATGSHRVRR
ncbi:MAG: aminotransferase class V-fold PLP-dependent enzyme [Streptosporangiales bacterium]|nr:aminotransferase class V-fold PLP-dependent enzyme [Streptosporangiales bacterium]